jgi:hypothetical protein
MQKLLHTPPLFNLESMKILKGEFKWETWSELEKMVKKLKLIVRELLISPSMLKKD